MELPQVVENIHFLFPLFSMDFVRKIVFLNLIAICFANCLFCVYSCLKWSSNPTVSRSNILRVVGAGTSHAVLGGRTHDAFTCVDADVGESRDKWREGYLRQSIFQPLWTAMEGVDIRAATQSAKAREENRRRKDAEGVRRPCLMV